jgi:hypothetical protein
LTTLFKAGGMQHACGRNFCSRAPDLLVTAAREILLARVFQARIFRQ